MNTDEASNLRRELHLAAAEDFRRRFNYDQGVLDCIKVLVRGLVQAELVASDFLISGLAERLKLWQEPTPDHPEGRNKHRAFAIEGVLSALRIAHEWRSTSAATVLPENAVGRPN
jgi:hypothetical protein